MSLTFGKSDYWMSEASTYFQHLSAARLSIALPPAPPPPAPAKHLPAPHYVSSSRQDIEAGLVEWTVNSSAAGINLTASAAVAENNVAVVTLRCAGWAPCPLDVTLGDTSNNCYHLDSLSGSTANDTVWFRKNNLHQRSNPAYAGSCDPEVLLFATQRSFEVDPSSGAFAMANGSCLWVDAPANATAGAGSTVSTGPCAAAQGKWTWRGNASSPTDKRGDLVWTGAAYAGAAISAAPLCLSSAVTVSAEACGGGHWTFDVPAPRPGGPSTTGYLGVWAAGPGPPSACLIAIPDNINNTMATAALLVDGTTGRPPAGLAIKPIQPPMASSGAGPNVSAGFRVTLEPGGEYVLLAAVLTLRDVGCDGTRPQVSACPARIEEAAAVLAQSFAAAPAWMGLRAAQARWWAAYWNASSIDLGSTANATVVERYWYLQQYVMAVTTRPGKVAPALVGNLAVSDPPDWNDQLTLDYNFEANFWGAGGSNHPEMYLPYIATVTNDGLLKAMRARATNPGVWRVGAGSGGMVGRKDGGAIRAGWSAPVGHTPTHATLEPGEDAIYAFPNATGFRGAAWTSTAYPLGDGRPCFSDFGTRFVGALVATDLIQYYEYTLDRTMLETKIYPVVRDNAEFYASYVVPDPRNASRVALTWTCAQEVCRCRNGGPGYGGYKDVRILPQRNMTEQCAEGGGDRTNWMCPGSFGESDVGGEHNAHPDIAFAAQSFRKAIEYSILLGVDAELREAWVGLLPRLPPYPSTKLTFLPGAIGSEVNGQTLLTEALVGPTPTPEPWYNASEPGRTGSLWPWCNTEYPITNFAAMWPTDEIGTVQTRGDTALLQSAHDTVWGLNQYTGYDFAGAKMPWAPSNGFCLGWPPAVRVSGPEDAADLLGKFAPAVSHRMRDNGLVSMHGGMLENMGGTVAVNEMLLQSNAGHIRLFPVWDAAVLGPAAFTTLRAYGAFLVSAQHEPSGLVASPVVVQSIMGAVCRIASPWPGVAPAVRAATGAVVAVSPVAGEDAVFMFETTANTTYFVAKA